MGSATKGEGGTRAKCAWDLGNFQMLETNSGDLTEFTESYLDCGSTFNKVMNSYSERSHWQDWFLWEVAQWYPLSFGVLTVHRDKFIGFRKKPREETSLSMFCVTERRG